MSKIKKRLAITLIVAAIAIIAGLSFIPMTVKDRAIGAAAVYDDAGITKLDRCAAYAATHGFTASMSGKISARVLGIKYVIEVQGSRKADDSGFTERAESVSSFVNTAIEKSMKNGAFTVRRGKKKRGEFYYDDEQTLTREQYIALYGKPDAGLTKYVTDGAITGVTAVADNAYRFTLDPVRATSYSKNEIKTTLGSKTYPKFSAVEFTLFFDGDRPVRVQSEETFRVDKFNGTTCTAEYCEVFSFD